MKTRESSNYHTIDLLIKLLVRYIYILFSGIDQIFEYLHDQKTLTKRNS